MDMHWATTASYQSPSGVREDAINTIERKTNSKERLQNDSTVTNPVEELQFVKTTPTTMSAVKTVPPIPTPSTNRFTSSASLLISTNQRTNQRESSRPIEEYNYVNFLSYCMYCPLYIAGPILTFNAYMYECQAMAMRKKNEDTLYIILYAVRLLFVFILLEMLLHYSPVFAIVNSGLFTTLTPSLLAATSYILLHIMWLKFLFIWRFFRLWALVDNMSVPENMLKCMSNNYSLSQFWRGWHASFNQWIIRYMYVPLGGRSHIIRNTICVFLFVALWHDAEMKLLVWGALNSIFLVAEVTGKRIIKIEAFQSLPTALSSLICAFAAAMNITALISVNMIGYAIGVDNMSNVVIRLLNLEGLWTITICWYILCVGYFIMCDIEEFRKTFNNKDCKI